MKFYISLLLTLYCICSYSSETLPEESQHVRDFLLFVRECRAGVQSKESCRVKHFGDTESSKTPVCIYSKHNDETYCMSHDNQLCFTSDAQPDDFAGTPLRPMLEWLHNELKTPGDSVTIFAPGTTNEQVFFERNRTMNKQPGSCHFTGIISLSDGVEATRADLFLD